MQGWPGLSGISLPSPLPHLVQHRLSQPVKLQVEAPTQQPHHRQHPPAQPPLCIVYGSLKG